MTDDKLVRLHYEFQESAATLLSLGLYKSAKWSAEALNGLPELNEAEQQKLGQYEIQAASAEQTKAVPLEEQNRILLAKTYFDCKEYDRVANVLKNCTSAKAVFLKLYSLYISGEKKLQEEFHEILGEKQHSYENKNVSRILKEIDHFLREHPTQLHSNCIETRTERINCSLLYYLSGIIYLKQKDHVSAQQNFIKALTLYQYNWECWNDLIASCSSFDEGLSVLNKVTAIVAGDCSILGDYSSDNITLDRSGKTPIANANSTDIAADANDDKHANIMLKIFSVVMYQRFYQQSLTLYALLDDLIQTMPNFVFLKTQKALISYNAPKYPLAESLFDEILVTDPYNLDYMDIYSNILFVMENKPKLSFLAQFANSIDKFRPETCCIIANYYSLKSEHEKAIMYYKRALNLNKNSLSAWTLMGHGFVELKNSHAAIESYRRAVDIDQKDYKAWYGLGQAYEVLDMYLYSLYYYQKACELRPLDKRMWTAVGNCFEKLGKYKESIRSYKKILNISMNEEDITFVLYKLGKLYELLNDYENAEIYMKLCFNEEVSSEIITEQSNKARLWLAKRELKKGSYKNALNYANEFKSGTSQEIEEARAIVRECRNK